MIASTVLTLLVFLPAPVAGLNANYDDRSAANPATLALPEAETGARYEFHIQTEGGLAPFKWRVVGGQLPPGIELDPSGNLRGVPAQARREPFSVLIEVSDSSVPPQTFTQQFSLAVKAAPLRIVPGAPNSNDLANPPLRIMGSPVARNSTGQPTFRASASESSPASRNSFRPVVSGRLRAYDKVIKGFAPPTAESVLVIISEVISPKGGATARDRKSLVARIPVTTIDRSTGEFKVDVPKLIKNESLEIQATVVENGVRTELTSDGAVVEEAEKPVAPRLIRPLLEGARTISGVIESHATRVEVKVFSGPADAEGENGRQTGEKYLVEKAVTEDISKIGEFQVGLKRPLAIGQTVQAKAFDGEIAGATIASPPTVETAGDWGRIRATFAAGVVLSKEEGDFSKKTPYVEFGLDYNWYGRGVGSTNAKNKQTASTAVNGQGSPRSYWEENIPAPQQSRNLHYTNIMVNTFLQTRLTAIASDDNKECSSNDILCSKKAALVQVGAYAPIYSNDKLSWSHNGDRNALFLAPIIKAGIQTTTEHDDKNLTSFYSGGVRFGHLNVGPWNDTGTFARDNAPRLISHLDITFGKWQNFEFQGKRLLRTGFEGRLKIPAMPLQIGFDANVGKGPDDLRFVIDTAFDLGDLFKKLFPPSK